jgi:multisubunit Na+/H+ antiporter MnhG subunit
MMRFLTTPAGIVVAVVCWLALGSFFLNWNSYSELLYLLVTIFVGIPLLFRAIVRAAKREWQR